MTPPSPARGSAARSRRGAWRSARAPSPAAWPPAGPAPHHAPVNVITLHGSFYVLRFPEGVIHAAHFFIPPPCASRWCHLWALAAVVAAAGAAEVTLALGAPRVAAAPAAADLLWDGITCHYCPILTLITQNLLQTRQTETRPESPSWRSAPQNMWLHVPSTFVHGAPTPSIFAANPTLFFSVTSHEFHAAWFTVHGLGSAAHLGDPSAAAWAGDGRAVDRDHREHRRRALHALHLGTDSRAVSLHRP